MHETIQSLKNLGLNKNQAKTYLALLNLGKSNVIDIAKESGVARTTVYDNIRVLKSYGLVTEGFENGKKCFVAESPAKLVNVLEEKKDVVESIVPELLKAFKSSKRRPKITLLEGVKGYKKVHDLSLLHNKKRMTRVLGEVGSLFTWLSEKYVKNYVQDRVKKGIRNQVLTTENILKRKEMYSKQRNKECLREVRYLENIGRIDTQIFNFDDVICIMPSSEEGYVIMIESREFTETFDSLFKFLWERAREV